MQQRTWLRPSRRVKYQCPLDQTLHWRTSPRTQIGGKLPSISPLIAELRLTYGPDLIRDRWTIKRER